MFGLGQMWLRYFSALTITVTASALVALPWG
jgi:hypothetical protein